MFNLHIPVQTRLELLKDWKSYQFKKIQDSCGHIKFKDGKCEACDLECEHWEWDEGLCLDCGKEYEGYDFRNEPEYWEDR